MLRRFVKPVALDPVLIGDAKVIAMPADLRAAHGRNDEVPERIYIGR
jgi:hypothetical protein